MQVLYLIEAVDEYCIQSLPEFEGKKFQNAAKEGVKLDASEKAKERKEATEKEFEPLLKWMKDDALKDKVGSVVLLMQVGCHNLGLIHLLHTHCPLSGKVIHGSYGQGKSGNFKESEKTESFREKSGNFKIPNAKN